MSNPNAPETRGITQAIAIANAAVVADVQSYGHKVVLDGATWWDIRPLVDPNEHAPQVVDQSRQGIDYGLAAGALAMHPSIPHYVRVTSQGARS